METPCVRLQISDAETKLSRRVVWPWGAGGVPVSAVLLLLLGLLLALRPAGAQADIISLCANTSVTEGNDGAVTCTITDEDGEVLHILGAFAFAEYLSGDGSDGITGVEVYGPNPPCVESDYICTETSTFTVEFTTTPGHPDAKPDFGLWDVSLILFAEDGFTGDFVPGFYGSAAVAVYDVGLPPMDPKDLAPVIPIFAPEDYYNTESDAESRGLVNNITPEPAPIVLLGSGLLGLAAVLRGRLARGLS